MRHEILERTIGTKDEENYSYSNACHLQLFAIYSFIGLSFCEIMFCLVYNKFVSIYKILYRTTKLIMNVSFTPGRISYKASVTVSKPWTTFKLHG